MIVDQALVARLAELARLELSPDELVRITDDLDRVLAYVAMLKELDTEGVEPLASVAPSMGASSMRPDEPRASLPAEVALAQAPRCAEGGFAVPRFVDEG
jgi:aspartyl-tRNA(Asn)/glutamyl-tRNA(Gln) amidotransferase subunit C